MDNDLLKQWKGTKKERETLIEHILSDIKKEHFSDMNDKQFNKLFAEAICRNLVLNELIDMMKYINNGDIE